MLTCRQASQLVSESQERTLGRQERWGLRLHLWVCVSCRRFERQVRLLRRVLRRLARLSESDAQGPDLSPAARERIRQALAERHDHRH